LVGGRGIDHADGKRQQPAKAYSGMAPAAEDVLVLAAPEASDPAARPERGEAAQTA
jgi:hypothetical protein